MEYRCVSAKLYKGRWALVRLFKAFRCSRCHPSRRRCWLHVPSDSVCSRVPWISGEATGINDSRRQLLSRFQLETESPKVPPFIFVTFHRSFSYTERERSALRTTGTKSPAARGHDHMGWVSFFLDLSTNLSSLNLRWRCTCVVSQSP